MPTGQRQAMPKDDEHEIVGKLVFKHTTTEIEQPLESTSEHVLGYYIRISAIVENLEKKPS